MPEAPGGVSPEGDEGLAAKLAFLHAWGAGAQAHSNADLFAHLRGTRELLASWGAAAALCDAGLFHSVYGTESRHQVLLPLERRQQVRELIGTEAEEIAYLFGAMRPATLHSNLERSGRFTLNDRFTGKWFFLSERRLRELCNLSVANWLEQRPRLPPVLRDPLSVQMRRMLPWLLPVAREALRAAYGIPSGELRGWDSSAVGNGRSAPG